MALVYDVGMYTGEDTAHYLSQGHTVVGIEANPALAEHCRQRFAKEVAAGRLKILAVVVAPADGKTVLYISEDDPSVSSLDERWASGHGGRVRPLDVPAVRFRKVLAEYGVPFYLKVDIEGADVLCLQDLEPANVPQFVSVEAGLRAPELLGLLRDLGYQRFKLICQGDFLPVCWPPRPSDVLSRAADMIAHGRGRKVARLRTLGVDRILRPLTSRRALHRRTGGWFGYGCSGPWGQDTPGKWMNYNEARRLLDKLDGSSLGPPLVPRWVSWDWHAAL